MIVIRFHRKYVHISPDLYKFNNLVFSLIPADDVMFYFISNRLDYGEIGGEHQMHSYTTGDYHSKPVGHSKLWFCKCSVAIHKDKSEANYSQYRRFV